MPFSNKRILGETGDSRAKAEKTKDEPGITCGARGKEALIKWWVSVKKDSGVNLKESSMAKSRQFEQQKEIMIVMDYNPRSKINISESIQIWINKWINKQMEICQLFFTANIINKHRKNDENRKLRLGNKAIMTAGKSTIR